jgi:hypothetical protein
MATFAAKKPEIDPWIEDARSTETATSARST